METNNKDLELSNLFDVKGKVALITGGGQSVNNQSITPLKASTNVEQAPALVSWPPRPLQSTVPRST